MFSSIVVTLYQKIISTNHNRTTRIHASGLKLRLKVEDGCSYYVYLVVVSAPRFC
jgi:hypothetical protein